MATAKQRLALSKMVENGGNASQAMIDAGYSKNTAKTPSKLTNSKAIKSEMASLLKAHGVTKEQYILNLGMAMNAMKQNNFTGEITPDLGTRLSANKSAERFLQLEEEAPTPQSSLPDFDGLDEIELTQNKAVFKRSDTQ